MRTRDPVVLGSLRRHWRCDRAATVGVAANVDRGETGQPVAVADGPPAGSISGPPRSPFCRTPTDPASLESSGRVATIAVHPTDPSRWLIGAGNGGVWESRNAGTSWVPLTDTAPTLAIGAVAFAPSNPNVIYAGTGEAASVGFAKAGLGMLKSTDGGSHVEPFGWRHLARASIKRVRIHPATLMSSSRRPRAAVLAATVRRVRLPPFLGGSHRHSASSSRPTEA